MALGCSPGMASWLSFRSLSSSSLTRLDWARDVTPGVWGRQQGGVLAAGEFLHSSRNLRSQMMRVPAKIGGCQALLGPGHPRPEHLSPEQGPWAMSLTQCSAMAQGHVWLWSHHGAAHEAVCDTRPAQQPLPTLLLPFMLLELCRKQHTGYSLQRATPWWPTQATPAQPGGQGQSWGTQRGPSPVCSCTALFQSGAARAGCPTVGTLGTRSHRLSHLLLLARGQQLGLVGHLLLQPAGCAVSTRGCLLSLLQLPASTT